MKRNKPKSVKVEVPEWFAPMASAIVETMQESSEKYIEAEAVAHAEDGNVEIDQDGNIMLGCESDVFLCSVPSLVKSMNELYREMESEEPEFTQLYKSRRIKLSKILKGLSDLLAKE